MQKRKPIYLAVILISAIAILVIFQVFRSDESDRPESQSNLSDEVYKKGKQLSQTYCTRCHSYPDPGLLPKETWKSETLPAMGPFLGISSNNGSQFNRELNGTHNQYLPPDYYPSEPQLNSEEWQTILNFYVGLAPEELSPTKQKREIVTDSLMFEARTPRYSSESPPVITAVKFDPGNRLIYLSDSAQKGLMVFDRNLQLQEIYPISTPISDIRFLEDPDQPGKRNMLLTYIGHLNPSDAPLGSVAKGWIDPSTGKGDIRSEVYRDSLTRPVESQFADLNGDGLEDLLMGEFGNRIGRLSWLENRGVDFNPERNVLVETPGCIQSHTLDFTNNGLKDVVSLCAQVAQSIYLFKNQGNGKFERETLLRFDITAGSTSFELHDFNDDGHLDILYTNGDNADYSKIYKPYHGVSIYLNDGNDSFTHEWFYPVNGAYRAVARDFNKNGRLDIAAISYFADYIQSPEEGFLFFKNDGGLEFTPYHPPAAKAGRWLTMDVADWTGDGYEDIILASFPFGPTLDNGSFRPNWEDSPHFLLLENKMNRI